MILCMILIFCSLLLISLSSAKVLRLAISCHKMSFVVSCYVMSYHVIPLLMASGATEFRLHSLLLSDNRIMNL